MAEKICRFVRVLHSLGELDIDRLSIPVEDWLLPLPALIKLVNQYW